MSTIVMTASVVLGCLIVGGIVFIFRNINWRSPSRKELMVSDDGDGNTVFENGTDKSGAIYRPADGEVEVLLFMKDSYSETYKAADADEAQRIYWDNIDEMQERWINDAGND